jgi:putative hydrolase of the HAD superfamily
VLFDAGATLLRADPPIEEVYSRAFARDGVRTTPPALRAVLETTWREIREKKVPNRYGGAVGERGFWEAYVRRVRFHLDGSEVSDRCFGELAAHFLRPEAWSVYPDVAPALAELRAGGYALAIVSNWDSTLGQLLDVHGLSESFSAILISAVEKSAKPHAEIFHRACGRLGLRAEEALHVGDSLEEDYVGARTAGLSALLLDREGRHSDVEDRISSLAELSGKLETLGAKSDESFPRKRESLSAPPRPEQSPRSRG